MTKEEAVAATAQGNIIKATLENGNVFYSDFAGTIDIFFELTENWNYEIYNGPLNERSVIYIGNYDHGIISHSSIEKESIFPTSPDKH